MVGEYILIRLRPSIEFINIFGSVLSSNRMGWVEDRTLVDLGEFWDLSGWRFFYG